MMQENNMGNVPIFSAFKTILIALIALLIIACDVRYGFIESRFDLAQSSRFPKWVQLPQGESRDSVTVTLYYYLSILQKPIAVLVVRDIKTGNKLMELSGTRRYHPMSEARGITQYPIYQVIKINGIDEVVEHKKQEPIFYLSDDPLLSKIN